MQPLMQPEFALSESWTNDPRTVLFRMARYKFVSKMLVGYDRIAEVGAGDGLLSRIVSEYCGKQFDTFDLPSLDITKTALPQRYDAVFALDVFEHISQSDSVVAIMNLKHSLDIHRGVLVLGTPSLESQRYAGEVSRQFHVNCLSGEFLRSSLREFFPHVFLFSMNDEVVHTGFTPMAHYLLALCVL